MCLCCNLEPSEDNYKEIDVRTKLFAENLVCWIILTDQWPYRISFILQIIEDADQRYLAGKKDQAIHEDMSLLEIYRYVKFLFNLEYFLSTINL